MTPAPVRKPAPARSRALVREVGGGSSATADFDARTAYDFAISLFGEAGAHEDLPAPDREWLAKARRSLPERLQRTIDTEIGVMGAALLVDRPDVVNAAAATEMVGSLPGRELATSCLCDEVREPEGRAAVEAALDGDEAEITMLLARWPDAKHDFLGRLLRRPDGVADELAELMTAWLPLYEEVEPRVRVIIDRDVALRARDQASLGAADLIERATNGIRWLGEAGIRRVILAPSYFGRPYNYPFAGPDWRLFVYPVADAALEPEDSLAPPAGVLRLHRALGDESRLRILRLLRDRDMYLTEIAERMNLSKPTINHHLVQLRAAGLVTVLESGAMRYYSLRRERLTDASADLQRYLS